MRVVRQGAARPGADRAGRRCSAGRRAARPSYVAGRRRDELGLSETELIVTRQALDDLRDRLYVLEAAVEDVGSGRSRRGSRSGDPLAHRRMPQPTTAQCA